MRLLQAVRGYFLGAFLIFILVCLSGVQPAFSAQGGDAAAMANLAPQSASAEHDGQHDFDFEIGTWKLHASRLQHPLTGSTSWTDSDGVVVVRKLWDGRGNLAEIELNGPSGHLEFFCRCGGTIQRLISGACILPAATAARWAFPWLGSSRMAVANSTIRKNSMAKLSRFDLFFLP
jgi:hypothetical protein